MRPQVKNRGQALVEMALGMTVFVIVLMGGIYFAEVGYLSLKVQDAAASALWKATASRDPNEAAIAAATNAEFADYDGVLNGSGPNLTGALTRGSGMLVSCQKTGGATNAIGFEDDIRVSCSAQGNVTSHDIPDQFLDGERGFFSQPLTFHSPLNVCSIGMPGPGGACRGQLLTWVNDWGLNGPEETANFRTGGSTPFSRLVESKYSAACPGGMNLAQTYAGAGGYGNVCDFRISYSESDGQVDSYGQGGPVDTRGYLMPAGPLKGFFQ